MVTGSVHSLMLCIVLRLLKCWLLFCMIDRDASRHRGHVLEDSRHPSMSAAVPSQRPVAVRSDPAMTADSHQMTSASSSSASSSRFISRQPSYLNAVSRHDELLYQFADPKMTPTALCRSSQYRPDRSGISPISENEEYQQSSHSAVYRQRCAGPQPQDDRRSKADVRHSSQADLWAWCKETATDEGAADIGTYIRRDDVRKVLQLRGKKMAAAATRKSSTPLNQTSAGLQQDFTVNHDSVALQQGSVGNQSGSRGMQRHSAGSQPGSSTVYRTVADLHLLRPNTDGVDSASISSQKDSGYRSEEDRHSGEGSPTLSASNSAVSLSSNNNRTVTGNTANFPDVKSLCSSYESLCSVQSGCSLPVTIETRLRMIPEGLHPPIPQDSTSGSRMRHEADEFFARSAEAVAGSGYRQPVKAINTAAMNSSYGRSSASVHQEAEFNSRPVSGRPVSPFCSAVKSGVLGGNDGYVRHAGSVPAINHLSDSNAVMSLLEGQCRRPATSCTGNIAVPSARRSVPDHFDVDQSASSARRVHGRGHFRETGGIVPSLRQTSSSKSSNPRQLIHHTAVPANRPPWK